MWSQVVDAVREVATDDVVAVGVCTQYSSVVPVDGRGKPVGPILMWQDQRGTDHCFDIMVRDEDAFMTWVERHGIPTIGSGLSLGHILYLQHDRPDVHERTAAYVEPMDYLTARATGRITASQHSTYMFQLCDNRTVGATQYDDDLVKLAGIDPSRLPPLVRVDEAVGPLSDDVADAFGVPRNIPVYAGTNDTATVSIASKGHGGLSIGTTSVLVDELDEFRVDLDHQLFAMPGPFPDRYVVCAENGLGGKVLEHMMQNVVYARDELGDHARDDAFAMLEAVLGATSAGAGGVMFLPWLNGSLAPGGDSNVRGGFVHISLTTTRRDMVRAVVEGVAHNLGWLLPHVEAFTGRRIDDIAFVGGAARSAQWSVVLADVLDRPILSLRTPDRAIARATALLALQRHGVLARDDLDALVEIDRRDEPDPERHSLYEKRQAQFEALYTALVPISEALTT
jgi:xylulokinase